MAKPYKVLREIIGRHEMSMAELAELLEIDQSTMSRKMMARTPWTSDQMWRIMDAFHIPAKELHIVFPAGGAAPSPRRTA